MKFTVFIFAVIIILMGWGLDYQAGKIDQLSESRAWFEVARLRRQNISLTDELAESIWLDDRVCREMRD